MDIASLVSGIAGLFWVAFIGLLVFVIYRSVRGQKIRNGFTYIISLAVIAVILTTVSAGIVFINPDERGVVISAISPDGIRTQPLQPGLSWIVPFLERVERYSISKQTYTMSIAPGEGQIIGDDSITARTSDGQQVLVDASVIYAINPDEVVNVHITWQNRYSTDLIRAVSRGIIRDAISQYSIEEVYSLKRLELTQLISSTLETKLESNGLVMDDFVLRNITFSDEYAASVEQKQIAEQQAQQAKFVVEQKKQEADQVREEAKGKADAAVTAAEGEAQARVIEAQAEAEALALIADVLNQNPNLLTYQYITKLSPNVEVMLLPNDNSFIFPLPEMNTGSYNIPVPNN
jgi:regulator of protease activity HflC (stomatin/prohibitin superfamily)